MNAASYSRAGVGAGGWGTRPRQGAAACKGTPYGSNAKTAVAFQRVLGGLLDDGRSQQLALWRVPVDDIKSGAASPTATSFGWPEHVSCLRPRSRQRRRVPGLRRRGPDVPELSRRERRRGLDGGRVPALPEPIRGVAVGARVAVGGRAVRRRGRRRALALAARARAADGLVGACAHRARSLLSFARAADQPDGSGRSVCAVASIASGDIRHLLV